MIYALINNDDQIVRLQEFDDTPPALTHHKKLTWMEYAEIRPELVDGKIHGEPITSIVRNTYKVTVEYPLIDIPVIVPAAVTPSQFRRALTAAGLRATVEATIAAADQDTKDLWQFANTVERSNVPLNQMATALNVTSEQLDAIFIAASKLD